MRSLQGRPAAGPSLAMLGLASVVVVAAPASTVHEGQADLPRVAARLTPMQQVPPVASPARGSFSATLDEAASTLAYELHYEGFDSEVVQAHLHAAQPGVNGGIMVWLCGSVAQPGPPGTPPCPPAPGTVSGQLTAEQVIGPSAQGISPGEFDEVLRAIRNGISYANVHTSRFPGGEIRGQLRPGWSQAPAEPVAAGLPESAG